MNYTFSGKIIVALDGRAYRFSNELGDSLGVSADGFLYTKKFPGGYRGNMRGTGPESSTDGYYAVTRGHHSVYIHQFVYELFKGTVPAGMEIDHIDGDKRNNSINNLRTVTKSGNMRNPVTRRKNLAQLSTVRHKAFEARRPAVAAYTDDGLLAATFISVTEAAVWAGTTRSCIAKVIDGKRKHAGGFTWRRVSK